MCPYCLETVLMRQVFFVYCTNFEKVIFDRSKIKTCLSMNIKRVKGKVVPFLPILTRIWKTSSKTNPASITYSLFQLIKASTIIASTDIKLLAMQQLNMKSFQQYVPGIETLNPFGVYTSIVASGTSYWIVPIIKLLNNINQNITNI